MPGFPVDGHIYIHVYYLKNSSFVDSMSVVN